jgi:hypothetical protein
MPAVSVEELDEQESRKLFERACQQLLGVSGETFMARHEAGYPDDWDAGAIAKVEFLLPFAV